MKIAEMIAAIRDYPGICADLEMARDNLKHTQAELQESKKECDGLLDDLGASQYALRKVTQRAAALSSVLNTFPPELQNAEALRQLYECVAPHMDEEGFRLYRAAVSITGFDLYGSYPYEDARGEFEVADGHRLMGYLEAECFGTADWDIVPGNCQNLNLWTPGLGDGEKRPVMVWFHGGGFSSGTANSEQYDGESLSRGGDVVVVTVNHRLNVFGHLDLSAYGEKYKNSGNVGVTDMVAALQWIQENIEAFGGDPDNVTVFGQSGGGAKVLALMTTPEAKGLFHKAIVQSGATETLGVSFASQDASTALTQRILDQLGITADHLEDIQTVSAVELQNAANAALQATADEFQIPAALGAGYAMEWGPVVDGVYLPNNPVTEASFAEAGIDIPLLIGSNLNEWAGFSSGSSEPTSEAVVAAFSAAYPDLDSAQAGLTDSLIRLPMLKIMSHKADQNGAPVYAYVFTQDDGRGSYHGAEIPYVFGHAQENPTLAAQMVEVWSTFARTGVPGAEGLPQWEPYNRKGGATMLLEDQSKLVHHHDQALMAALVPDYVY